MSIAEQHGKALRTRTIAVVTTQHVSKINKYEVLCVTGRVCSMNMSYNVLSTDQVTTCRLQGSSAGVFVHDVQNIII